MGVPPRVARCGYRGWEEPGVCGSPHPRTTRSLAADRTKVFPSVRSGPRLHPHVAALHSLNPFWIVFCPPVSRLGNGESESCSSRSKLNYIHQPGASTIVPRAFPALIRMFYFPSEAGQSISASITLPGGQGLELQGSWSPA